MSSRAPERATHDSAVHDDYDLGNTITENASGVAALFGSGLRIGFRQFSDAPWPNLIVNNLGTARPLGGNGVLVADNATVSIIGGNEISGNNIVYWSRSPATRRSRAMRSPRTRSAS